MSAEYRLPGPRQLSALLSYQWPLPAWLPAGWRSRCYPKVGSVEAIWDWLDHEATSWDEVAGGLESGLLDGEKLRVCDLIDSVRDGYSLVRELAGKHGCQPPPGPQEVFSMTPEGCRAAAAELRRLREWARTLPQHDGASSLGGKGGPATRKRRGRPKADYDTVQREAEIARAWERARDAGRYKPDFAKEHNMTVAELDALLDRVRERESRAE